VLWFVVVVVVVTGNAGNNNTTTTTAGHRQPATATSKAANCEQRAHDNKKHSDSNSRLPVLCLNPNRD
jgi:hypothetical protein